MPLYEYKCASCGGTFEIIQKFSDAPLQVHEKCGGHVERLISTSALQFKGTGWYVTDYAKGNGNSQPSKDGKKEGKSEGKSEGEGSASSTNSASKTETKSAPTTPASSSDKKG
jgi:putative FmdB family regulatory protein